MLPVSPHHEKTSGAATVYIDCASKIKLKKKTFENKIIKRDTFLKGTVSETFLCSLFISY